MIKDKSIFIKNIYYMLAYAFQDLKKLDYDKLEKEEFENIQDLFAEILARGTSRLLKQGLYREYIIFNEDLSTLKGKLNIVQTIKNKIQHKQKLNCEYDELSENNIFNQILKTTIRLLLKDKSIKSQRKQNLKRVSEFLNSVNEINPTLIRWNRLNYQRNNKSYEMLMNICRFVIDSWLMTTQKGEYKFLQFSDEQMERLYEKFVLEYYKKHYKGKLYVCSPQIEWALDENQAGIEFLPKMQTDITLKSEEKTLIIDTKYYTKTMTARFDKQKLISANLYQIFTYVKNEDKNNTGNVSGMLLYARTDEDITPDFDFTMNGNKISVKTLDLNTDFNIIAKKLDEIANSMKNN